MNIKVLLKENFLTTKSLLFHPEKEWNYIKKDKHSYNYVVFAYFVPSLLVLFLAHTLGQLLWKSHELLLWDVVLLNALRMPLVYCFSIVTAIEAAEQLLKNVKIMPERRETTTLFVYSFTPFLLASTLVGVAPGLQMIWLLGFYSFRLLAIGSPQFYSIGESNKKFILLITLVWLSAFIFYNFLFGKILSFCL